MGESFRRIREDYREPNELDRGLENGPESIKFISASVRKKNKFNKELGPIIGITDIDDLAELRRHLQDGETVPQLKDVVLDIKGVNFLRNYYGFEALSQEEYELLPIQSTGVKNAIEQVDLEEEISTPEGEQREGKQTAVIDSEIHNRDKGDGGLDNILNRYSPEDEHDKRGGATTLEVPAEHDPRQDEIQLTSEKNPSELDSETQTLLDALPGSEELEKELEDLADSIVEQETGGALARIEGEISPGEGELETLDKSAEIEQLKRESLQAIATYQQFAQEHPFHTRDQPTKERYRALERSAWEALNKLAHINGGEIFALPQKRDIYLSHPEAEAKNIKDYLESQEYGFDGNGNIITIKHHSKNIELNRSYSVADLIDKARPAHILTDINLDAVDSDLHHTGYVLPGLNPQTPDFIVRTLSKDEFIQRVIVNDPAIEQVQDTKGPEEQSEIVFEENTPGIYLPINNDKLRASLEGEVIAQDEQLKINSKEQLDNLRTAYARAEEAWNRKRGDENLKIDFENARARYNSEFEKILKSEVAEGQQNNIHQIFQDEVISLRDSRIGQSQELQGKWEKKFNGAKERFLGWATKNKTRWMLVNIGLFAGAAVFSMTGAGIPVSGALEATRRSLGAVMSGVGARNSLVGLMEDGEINRLGIKFKAVIPKLVGESLEEGYIKQATDTDLSTKLSTLEAYYRLNGGKFTNESQQTAYESILNELGQRVQKNVISSEQNQNALASNSSQSGITEITDDRSMSQFTSSNSNSQYVSTNEPIEPSKKNTFNFGNEINPERVNSERFTSELLTSLSKTRVNEFAKLRRNRNLATIAGIATTGILGSFLINDMAKPGGMFRPNVEDSSIKSSTEGVKLDTQNPEFTSKDTGLPPGEKAPEAPILPDPESGEVVRKGVEQVVDKGSFSLDPGETLWSEMSKQLGPNASPDQIQHAFENYVQSEVGQNTVFELAGKTEGGRALLTKWGIVNANEMYNLSQDQLYQVSKYLAPGQLEGITKFSINKLDVFPSVENSLVDSTLESTVPANSTEFTETLSQALDTNNLTDTQIGSVLEAYPDKVSLYDLLLQNEVSNPFIAELLDQYGVYNIKDFANLSGPELYELAQAVGVENLDKLPGFELNDIILAKFENAPDSLTLVDSVNGTKPLSLMDKYIAQYAGDLPGSGSLGKLVLEEYVLETDEGKAWLYDAIQNHQAPNSQLAFELQKAKELFSQEGIKSPADLEKLLVDRNGNPSAQLFWEKLSRVLKPGPMPGIKKALQLVLTK